MPTLIEYIILINTIVMFVHNHEEFVYITLMVSESTKLH